MLFIIALLTFGSVALITYEFARPRPDVLRRRLRVDETETRDERESRVQGSLVSRTALPIVSRLGRLLARLLPSTWVRGVDRMLMMANEPWSLGGFLTAWALSTVLGALFLYYTISSLENPSSTQVIGISLLIVPMALLLPYAVLRNRVKKRQKAIVRALPDAMDLLVTSVEAGMGVDAAFALVTEKTEGPLSDTFSLYLRQVGLGRGREEALMHAAQRTGVPDLITIAHAVNQGEELGSPIGDVLRRQAEDLRVARRQRAQIAAQRAPVLMTIPLALCFLPAMFAVVVVPSILNLMNFVGDLGG